MCFRRWMKNISKSTLSLVELTNVKSLSLLRRWNATFISLFTDMLKTPITSVSETIRKPPLVKAQASLKKIWRKTIFSMADGILTPCNVARLWHRFRDCTLQCGMWLWNHDSEFTKWQHPAMWHVALGSWHWICQVAAHCNVAGGSGMTCHWIRPKRPPYWNSTSGFDVDHITAVDMSFCTVCKILSKSDQPRQKKWSCRFSRFLVGV